MPHITNITIGRLFNLGNYEHVRYELSVALEPGDDARKTLERTARILGALNPKRPDTVPSESGIEGWRDVLKTRKAMTAKQWEKSYGDEDQQKSIAALEEKIAHGTTMRAEWKMYREEALSALNDLGGTTIETDAKDKWEDFDDRDY